MNKIAIIGLGRWGKVLLNEFAQLADVAYGVNNGNKEEGLWLKKNYPNITYTTDLNLVLKDQTIDSVVIATSINTHFVLAKKFLQSGKNIFLEKPPCLKYDEGLELLKIATSKKKILFVDNIYCSDPSFILLKRIVKNKKLKQVSLDWKKWGSFTSDIIWNLAYHDIFIASALLGLPQKLNMNHVSENHAEISTHHNKGDATILIDREYNGKPQKCLTVKLENKIYTIKNGSLYLTENGKKKLLLKAAKSLTKIVCQNFIDALKRNYRDYQDYKFSIQIVKAIDDAIGLLPKSK